MPKRKRQTTPGSVKRRRKEGRGHGRGADYIPELNIHDVASSGMRYRVFGTKTGRIHHYLSRMEYMYHWILEFCPQVLDIREQFPLDREMTQFIAEKINVKHPLDPVTKHPITMTTDFCVTIRDGLKTFDVIRTVKPTSKISKRALEKFEIERVYFSIKKMDWGIITEQDIPEVVAKNIELISGYHSLKGRSIADDEIDKIADYLEPKLLMLDTPLNRITTACDIKYQFDPGTSLAVFYHMLCLRIWEIDLQIPFMPDSIIQIKLVE